MAAVAAVGRRVAAVAAMAAGRAPRAGRWRAAVGLRRGGMGRRSDGGGLHRACAAAAAGGRGHGGDASWEVLRMGEFEWELITKLVSKPHYQKPSVLEL